MKHHERLEEALCKELERLDKKYGGEAAEMTAQDIELADTVYHALKCAATYNAMKDAEWDEGESETRRMPSYTRRDSMGRFSRDYRDMDASGHYPMMPYGREPYGGWRY